MFAGQNSHRRNCPAEAFPTAFQAICFLHLSRPHLSILTTTNSKSHRVIGIKSIEWIIYRRTHHHVVIFCHFSMSWLISLLCYSATGALRTTDVKIVYKETLQFYLWCESIAKLMHCSSIPLWTNCRLYESHLLLGGHVDQFQYTIECKYSALSTRAVHNIQCNTLCHDLQKKCSGEQFQFFTLSVQSE